MCSNKANEVKNCKTFEKILNILEYSFSMFTKQNLIALVALCLICLVSAESEPEKEPEAVASNATVRTQMKPDHWG